MGIFKNDEEVAKILNHKNNGLKKIGVEVKIIGSGKHGNGGNKVGNKHKELTTETKAEVSVLATLLGGKTASEITGISEAQVSKFKNGKNSNNDGDIELVKKTESKLDQISNKALEKVSALMDFFSEDTMSSLKPEHVAPAAEKMMNIFDKINKKSDGSEGSSAKPTVVLYAPKQININQYPIKEV